MKNTIDDLRNHLFATLEALQDEDKPMDIDRARAIADVAKVVVDSAKVEVDLAKATGATIGTGFVPLVQAPVHPAARQLAAGAPRRCAVCTAKTLSDPCENCGTPWKQRV